ncbi:MAG: 2,3-bisphosphoglycerate-independent phosphoglycerate mutase [Mycoplasmataceae bacterium]|jgi:2,3-bisphosphoglycerate-independent phosphoglycerate mutase|nr:2,3-bisphosphoglycerate-independent phosphoglycerate mutase [Mycoplasmataceae bacterium]
MPNQKVGLIIMDGVGVASPSKGNAYTLAKHPNLDALIKKYPHIQIKASEQAVGLPKGQMGNSEVGHLNLGAGRIIYTGLSIIDKDIKENKFKDNPAFNQAFDHVLKHHSKLHIMGLVSDGGIHSSMQHIEALIKLAINKKIPFVVHCFTDGRDTPPISFGKSFLPRISRLINHSKNGSIGTIISRYYAMDRDKNWDRSMKAYDALIGEGEINAFLDPHVYLEQQFAAGIKGDEFIEPAINVAKKIKEVTIQDHDAVINVNFRPDRARQISHLIFGSKYYDYQPPFRRKNLFYVTMMNYEGIEPSAVAYPPIDYLNVFGEVLAKHHLTQLRISETEKYAHVTFFFDGGKELTYDGEKKIIIPSPKVATYDLQPEMSAEELTDKIIEEIPKFDVIIANYPNGDMVGHTANINASIKAVETVDAAIGKIYEAAQKHNMTLFICADHGNVECLLDDKNKPFTAHTINPVPLIVTDEKVKLAKTGALANIAPTILDYLKIAIPSEMDQPSLLIKHAK